MAEKVVFYKGKRNQDIVIDRHRVRHAHNCMVDVMARWARNDPVAYRESFRETLLMEPKNEDTIRLVLEKNNDIEGLAHLEKVLEEIKKETSLLSTNSNSKQFELFYKC